MAESKVNDNGRTDWLRVLLLVGAGMAAAFQIGKAPPVLPVLQKELVFGLFISGWVLSSLNVVGMLFSSAAGGVADWLGHRRLILFGLACQAAASFCGSLAQGPELLLVTRFFEGLGYTLIVVSAPALVVRLVQPRDFRLAFGVWGGFMPAGSATMMLLAPMLVDLSGWRGLWRINAVLLLCYMVILGLLTRDLTAAGQGERFSIPRLAGNIWRVVKSGAPLILALCFGAYTLQFISVIGFLPTMFIEEEHLGPGLAAALSALVMVVNVIGNLAGGWLLNRGNKRWILIGSSSLIMSLATFGIYSAALSLPVRYLFCLVFSSVGGILPATALEGAAARAPAPNLIGTSNGLLMQGAQTGLLAGPPLLAAFVVRMGGWQSAPLFLSAIGLLGVILALVLRLEERIKGIG